MTTLFEITYEVAKAVGDVMEGVTDSGSVATIVDSDRQEEDGFFNGGTLFVLSGDNAGAMAAVTGFKDNTITVDTQANAFAAGDRYAVCDSTFPLWRIQQAINSVVGDVLSTNESLSFTAGTYQYTLPTLSGKVIGVEFVDTQDRAYPSHFWSVRGGTLYFVEGRGGGSGDTIRLLVQVPHDDMVNADDVLDGGLNKMKVVWDAAVDVLRWGYRRYANDPSKRVEEFLQFAMVQQKKYGARLNDELPVIRYKSAGWG